MTSNRIMAGSALVLALFAAVAGTPYAAGADGDSSVSSVHVVDVAEWIRDRRTGLQIVDLRPSEAFDRFNIPTAINVQLGGLGVSGLDSTGLVVVYDDGSGLAERGKTILKALGFDSVSVLRDGVGRWVADILNPAVARDATDMERAEFDRVVDLSRYFGGMPRVVDRVDLDESASTKLTRTLRLGCAF